MTTTLSSKRSPKPLAGVRVLSLALNLPGPAALMQCQQLGARCVKLEPPGPANTTGLGDPMAAYRPVAYRALHQGVRTVVADLKSLAGQQVLHKALAKTDVLLTSFRPSALKKLGLSFADLQKRYPQLNQVAIVGAPAPRQEEPGHDLTYMAENDLVVGLDLPPSLYADMGGSLMATQAILELLLLQRAAKAKRPYQIAKGRYREVALSDAAAYLGLPRAWQLTTPGQAVGGGHAGYKVYACKDGRVAIAALEPHFAARLAQAAGMDNPALVAMTAPATHLAIAAWCSTQTRKQLARIAQQLDIPMHDLA
jgi:alpha-methylacyl-CoA racemase